MTVTQLSVFTESKPGHLAGILNILEKANISVRGFSVSDTGDYGIARFIVDDPDGAQKLLEETGKAFTLKEVLCLKLADVPGELARVMGILAECNVNVKYSYSMISTYIIISTDDIDATKDALSKEPINIITQADIRKITADRFA